MELRDYLHFERKTVKEFAEELNVNRCYLSGIVTKKKFPSRKLALVIEQKTGGKVKKEEVLF